MRPITCDSSVGTSPRRLSTAGGGCWAWACNFSRNVAAGKGASSGQQEEKRAAQAVNVGADVGRVRIGRLFRRHEVDRAQQGRRGAGRVAGAGLADELRQPEIQHLDLPLVGDHQVAGGDVAVDHAVLVGMLQAGGRLADVIARPAHRQRALAADHLGQVGAGDEFHHQEMPLAGGFRVVDRHHVGMIEAGGGAGLAHEAIHGRGIGQQLGVDHLQRHGPLQDAMLGE